MPGPDSYPVRSASQAHVAGSTLRFNTWIPRRGPNGGRAVIDGFELLVEYADINVATTAVQGADLWRSIRRLQVEQAAGVLRWNLRGDELRTMCYGLEGPHRIREFADTGTTADQAIKLSFYVPMERRYAVEPRDFSLPAEVLSEVRIECADVAELDDDGGTVTIDSLSYSVIAWCHEEFAIRILPHDVIAAMSCPSTSGVTIPVNGRLHDLYFFARGTSGGASLANFTDVRIDQLLPIAMRRDPDLLSAYQRDRRNGSNLASADGGQVRQDPFNIGKAVPVLWTTERTSCFDGPLTDQAIVYLTNSVANLLALYRVIKPRDPNVVEAVCQRHGLPESAFRVKTRGKSKRDRSRWPPEHEAYMPLVAPLPR
jgi:hypothetical protein